MAVSVSLQQLVKMTPEQRAQRLRGIDEPTRIKLLQQAAEVLAAISNEGLRKAEGSAIINLSPSSPRRAS